MTGLCRNNFESKLSLFFAVLWLKGSSGKSKHGISSAPRFCELGKNPIMCVSNLSLNLKKSLRNIYQNEGRYVNVNLPSYCDTVGS